MAIYPQSFEIEEPNLNFRPFLTYFFIKNRFLFAGMIAAMAIRAVCHSFIPYFIGEVVDSAVANSIYQFSRGVLVIGGLWLLMEISTRAVGILGLKTFPLYKAQIREAIYTFLKKCSPDFFNNNLSGAISNKIMTIAKSAESLMEIIIIYCIEALIHLFVYSYLLLSIDFKFLLIFYILIFMHTLITIKMYNSIYDDIKQASQTNFLLGGYLGDYLTNIFAVKSYSGEAYEKNQFNIFQNQEVQAYKKSLWSLEIMNCFKSGASFSFIIAISLILIFTDIKKHLSSGELSLLFLVCLNVTALCWRTSQEIAKLFREAGSIRSVLDFFLDESALNKEVRNLPPINITKGEVIFDNVKFTYTSNGETIFEEFDLKIQAGEKVGIMGASGAGKSTIFNLILGLYVPQSGKIIIDKQDIHYSSHKTLREQITFIPQDCTLFHRSIVDNIRYGKIDASLEEIINASRLARCHEFIISLPQKYDTVVGERGLKLSGGQRQRILIARAILKNTALWLIDEATASLDEDNELYIHQSLDEVFKNKTVIIVSHKASTLKNMDRILILDKGKITKDNYTVAPSSAQREAHSFSIPHSTKFSQE